jgi:glyoxylase-like metal-dependent hydrolase (beta-lactamase superfamily II)
MRALTLVLTTIGAAAMVAVVAAQPKSIAKVDIKSQKLAAGVYMMEGAGGNMGLLVGKDGAFLIDDQFAPLTPKILATTRKLGGKEIRFVLNTHWHGDHTGGNENLGNAGAVIVAHENVRKRMSVEQFVALKGSKVPPSPAKALPVVTFAGDVAFHLNGEDIHIFYPGPAHTDGDAVVHLVKANVIHMGDTLMTMSYPFVDTSSGGSYAGFIATADRVLSLADASTKIIPGHGKLTDRAGLQAWREMLVAIRDRVTKAAASGKTLQQVQAANLTQEWDARYGVEFITPAQIVEAVYLEVKAKR